MTAIRSLFNTEPTVEKHGGSTYHLHSNLTAALNHARSATGRNPSGTVSEEAKTGDWLGNVAYMMLVDLLATIFGSSSSGNKAKYTGYLEANGFTPVDALAVYELRCSLAHEFGLVNKPNRRFVLVASPTEPLVTHPTNAGPLVFGSIRPEQVTTVNLRALGEKIESILASAKAAVDGGTLTTTIPDQELKDRFFFLIGPLQP